MPKIAFAILSFIIISVVPFGMIQSACYTDTPGCPGFVDGGAWDPAKQALTEVARSTLGTVESCVAEGGKPYYQMCRGINNKDWCELMALLDLLGWTSPPDRGWWCSEAVSYWHREAQIPYENGLAYPTDPTHWLKTNTMKVANFYKTEEASGGRGNWVDGTEIDYENFQPGINAPCPGSFIAIDSCNISASGAVTWSDTDFHSLIVDDMTVHKDINHKIYKVEMDFIEGNSSHMVKVDTSFSGDDDLFSYTVKGDKWIGSNRKIMGFGINLDSRGNPIMSKPIKYVDLGRAMAPPLSKLIKSQESNAWNKFYKALVTNTAAYRKKVQKAGGLKFTTNISGSKFTKLPTQKAPWVFKANPKQASEVVIDLIDLHPETIRKFNITFDTYIPLGFRLAYSTNNKVYKQAVFNEKKDMKVAKVAGSKLPLTFKLNANGSGARIRYVKLIFPKGVIRESAKLVDCSFETDEGPAKDSEVNITQDQQ